MSLLMFPDPSIRCADTSSARHPRRGGVKTMDLDLLVGGLTAGSLYALVAMGFNVLYRPTNVFNFAQGDLVMLGAMLGATLMTMAGLPWFAGAGLAMLGVAVLALVEERIAVAPVLERSATGHGWVITTLAVSMIFANVVGLFWGPDASQRADAAAEVIPAAKSAVPVGADLGHPHFPAQSDP